MNTLLNPSPLQKGDLISIVSPSAGLGELFPFRVQNGVRALERMGYRVKIEKNALKRNDWVSGTVEERVEDLHAAFSNPEVKAILCAIGGDHSNQLLRSLDFDLIKRNPKIFIGYSDITVLHYALYTKANLRTFYGPCLISEFGEYPDVLPYTKNSFEETVTQGGAGKILPSAEWTDTFLDWFDPENQVKARPLQVSDGYEWWRNGRAEGQLIGGCIPSMNHVLGTEYWVDPKGMLFFIDIPEGGPGTPVDMASLDSFFADLDNAHVFEGISGLVIGRPYQFTETESGQFKDVVMKYAGAYDYPIVYNVNIGHCAPSVTLAYGVSAEIDASQDLFRVNESWISEHK